MTLVRRYRLVALTLMILLALATFLSFFFVFVLAPIAIIGLFYIVYVIAEERLALSSALREGMSGRRAQLARETEARRTLLARGGPRRLRLAGRR